MRIAPILTPTFAVPFVLTVSLASTTPAAAGATSVSLVVNGEAPVTFNGSTALEGSYVDPDGRWTVTWKYNVEGDPTDVGSMIGKATFENTSGQTAFFDFILDLPICPLIAESSSMAGSVSLKVYSLQGSAMLQSIGQNPVFSALADSDVGGTIFDAPFFFGGGGGMMSTNGSFGGKDLEKSAPAIEEAAGTRIAFAMNSGPVAEFVTNVFFGGESHNLLDCDSSGVFGDLSGNGKVGVADLVILLGSWGACNGCPADLDGDGKVGIGDLIVLLANWT